MTGSDIIRTLDDLLKDDRNFDTRAGLRLYAELVRDAFRYIEEQKKNDLEKTSIQNSILTRISVVEMGLKEFLERREAEQKKAEEERSKWRWAIIAPMLVILLNNTWDWLKAFVEFLNK